MQRITYSSNLTVDHAISLPEFQNSYGRLENGTSSWGNQASLTDYDNAGNFFNNGITAMNSVSIRLAFPSSFKRSLKKFAVSRKVRLCFCNLLESMIPLAVVFA